MADEERFIDTPEGILAYYTSGVHIRGMNIDRKSNGELEMSVVVKGTIRGSASEIDMALDPLGNQFVTMGGLPWTEITRQGQGWSCIQASATAALVAVPTVTTGLELWNGYTTKCLVVDRLFSHNLVSSTTGLGGGAGIYAMVTTVKAPPATASLVVRGHSGKAYNGSVINAVGTTVVANGWFPWGTTRMRESAGSVVPAGILTAEVGGRLIVPPGASLCVTVVSGYAADTFTSGASWYEVEFPTGYTVN